MEFHAVDTLTGRLLDRLYPTSFELNDPLRAPGHGTLTFAKPTSTAKRQALVELTRPRSRWIAAKDSATGLFLPWGGPILKRPSADETSVTLSVIDWRGWFYRSPLRPSGTASGDYIAKGVDQATMFTDFVTAALTDSTPVVSHLSVPPMIVDAAPETGVLRDRTVRHLDGNIGSLLDGLVNTERGIDWWTYVVTDPADPTRLQVHVTMAHPERTTGADTLLSWVEGEGGTASDAVWPDASEAFSRVWGIGDGEPPDQVWAYDEDPDATVLWEKIIGPLDGVKKAATAFEYAYAELQRSRGRENHADFTITEERLALSAIEPGDRVRVNYSDGWESADIADARVIERVIKGGQTQPTTQRLVVDLADTEPPASDEDPGVAGEEEV